MGRRTREFLVTLERENTNIPWGFSLAGGADLNTPLVVTRVDFGGPADRILQRGDIVTKIGNYDSRDIRHQDAKNLFRNAGSNIKIVVQRDPTRIHGNTSTGSSISSSFSYSPLPTSPHLSPKYDPSDYLRGGPALTPVRGAPFEEMVESYIEEVPGVRYQRKSHSANLDVHVDKQPYRTTPLVLPGAKIKREPGPTESYLRHHPNPAVRAPPSHLDYEHIAKQRVADTVLQRIVPGEDKSKVVHKQFNSPIGLYSDSAIADTVHRQTGIPAMRSSIKYDPAKSETFKAIQEEQLGERYQEVTVPPQSKVYVPNKAIPAKKPINPHYTTQKQSEVNSLGVSEEKIQQSNSFKRLMWSVLPETDF